MKPGLISVTVAAVLGIGGVAGATTMVPLDLKALTDRADRVVLATVESATSHWTADHDSIYTEVALRVSRVYKGALKSGDSVVVRREGGSAGGIGMKVFGAAQFTVGEEAVVFLEARGAASWVVGMTQGKLRVTLTADGRKQVEESFAGVHFVGAKQRVAQTRALDELERDIRAYVSQSRSGQ